MTAPSIDSFCMELDRLRALLGEQTDPAMREQIEAKIGGMKLGLQHAAGGGDHHVVEPDDDHPDFDNSLTPSGKYPLS